MLSLDSSQNEGLTVTRRSKKYFYVDIDLYFLLRKISPELTSVPVSSILYVGRRQSMATDEWCRSVPRNRTTATKAESTALNH